MRRNLRVRMAVPAVMVLVGLVMAGCGFSPVYRSGAPIPELSRISVAPIPDRQGQILRTMLEERLQRDRRRRDLTLSIDLEESRTEQAIRSDDTPTRTVLTFVANYRLERDADETGVVSGTSRIQTSFNLLDQIYATVVSERAARERAMRLLAEDIARRLAAYFEANRPAQAGDLRS